MTVRVWLFGNEYDVPYQYEYVSRLDVLETQLRGQFANMIVVKGLKANDVPEALMKTFELIVFKRDGWIYFVDDNKLVKG